MGAQLVTFFNGLPNDGVRVALQHGTERVVEVPHLIAVDVPDLGALSALQVDWPGVTQLVGRGDSTGQVLPCDLVHFLRLLCALVQLLCLNCS